MFLFAFGEKEHLGAAAVEFHLAEFVDAEKATMVRARGVTGSCRPAVECTYPTSRPRGTEIAQPLLVSRLWS